MSADDSGARGPQTDEKADPTLRLVTEMTAQMFGPPREETWAVAVLNDGTEIRIRHLGDRVEVRGWDPKAECRPPTLRAHMLGHYHHIVDISAAVDVPGCGGTHPGACHVPDSTGVCELSTPPASTPEEA